MKPQELAKKIIEKLQNCIFSLLNMDPITYTKILKRKDLQKIGTKYGGWVIPASLLNKKSICYCVGCGEDISFDTGLIDNFSCNVYAFDPTPTAINYVKNITSKNSNYHFYEFGLWDKEDTLKFFVPKNSKHVSHSLLNLQKTKQHIFIKVKRLSSIMRDLGHTKIDILKIDIEGAEYKVIESIIKDDIDIKIICVEYDEYFCPIDAKYKKRIRKSISSLIENNYSLVCAQGNANYTFVKN